MPQRGSVCAEPKAKNMRFSRRGFPTGACDQEARLARVDAPDGWTRSGRRRSDSARHWRRPPLNERPALLPEASLQGVRLCRGEGSVLGGA